MSTYRCVIMLYKVERVDDDMVDVYIVALCNCLIKYYKFNRRGESGYFVQVCGYVECKSTYRSVHVKISRNMYV
jgi:hypothetical protein